MARFAAIIACASSVVLVSPTSARAEYWSGGMPTASWTISNYSYNDQWQPGMDLAVANWNATLTPAEISKSATPKGTITAASYDDTWYGFYTSSGPRDSSRTFRIQLNARTIAAAQRSKGGTMKNWVAAIFVHELGHGLSLKDNPNTTKTSIMKYRSNWSTLTSPATYDIADVNSTYD